VTRLFAFACLLIAFEAAHAVPARPLYVPEERPKLPPRFEFGGSYWFGKCYETDFWVVFEKNGVLSYGYSGNTFKNGTWKLEGTNLYFEMNNRYLEFRGTMQGDLIQGESWNVAGGRWDTRFARMEKK